MAKKPDNRNEFAKAKADAIGKAVLAQHAKAQLVEAKARLQKAVADNKAAQQKLKEAGAARKAKKA